MSRSKYSTENARVEIIIPCGSVSCVRRRLRRWRESAVETLNWLNVEVIQTPTPTLTPTQSVVETGQAHFASHRCGPSLISGLGRGGMCEMFRQLLAVGRRFPRGTLVFSTRELISSSSFHRLDMTLAVAEALNPNKQKKTLEARVNTYIEEPSLATQGRMQDLWKGGGAGGPANVKSLPRRPNGGDPSPPPPPGALRRISSYTWLFTKNTGRIVVLQ